MNVELIDQIKQNMEQRTTEELLAIWIQNNRKKWSDEAFEAIIRVLTERGVYLPNQQDPSEAAQRRYVGYAGFWRRWVAFVIDSIALNMFFGAVFFIVIRMFSHPEIWVWLQLYGSLFGIIMSWLYFALMESSTQQATVGKRAMNIVVTDLEGNQISFGRATGRYFARYISSAILLIGYIMAAFTAKKQALHDIITSCLVIEE